MDDDSLSGLLVIFVLLVMQAFLTLVYAALTNVRIGQMRDLTEEGNTRARTVVYLATSTNLTLTYEVLSVLLHFATAGVAVLNVSRPMLSSSPDLNPLLIHVLVLGLTALVTIIVARTVPEAIGSSYAPPLALLLGGLMKRIVQTATPLIVVLLAISRALSSLFKSSDRVNRITEEEIMTLVDAGHTGGTIEDEEKEMIYSVLQLDQTRASEVMVPRMDVYAIGLDQTLEDAGSMFIQSGYSRLPVFQDNLDTVKGLLYAKDLLAYWTSSQRETRTIADLMRQPYFVPETKRVDELLKEMQTQKIHMAIVTDEYGGTAGVVTIEDIIEEIIGDIQDEYDLHEEADYEAIGVDEYHVAAGIDLDDFNELLNVDLPTEDSDTLGGYIYQHFGRVPLVGEIIDDEHLHMRVLSVDGRRIRKLYVQRKRVTEEAVLDEQAPAEVASKDGRNDR